MKKDLIRIEEQPLDPMAQKRIRDWFSSMDAVTLRECAVAQRNQYYAEAINIQIAHGEEDPKFVGQHKEKIELAKSLNTFLDVLDSMANPAYSLHKIKILS